MKAHVVATLLMLAASAALALSVGFNEDAALPAHDAQKETMVYAEMKTSKGAIVLELNQEKAPISVENFVQYAKDGGYDGTIFHRVIDNFMIQGGGFEPDMSKRPTRDPIKNEWKNGLTNSLGTIAMARLGGAADSATNQFFINVGNNTFLDQPRDGAGYAVFGKVVKGMEVVNAIKGVKTADKMGHGDVPVEPVLIESVTVLEAAPEGLGS